MRASFAKSDGWKEKVPRSNQLCAPRDISPTIASIISNATEVENSATEAQVDLKNLKSMKLRAKKAAREIIIAVNWCAAKEVSPVNECIVTKLAARIGMIASNKIQSIFSLSIPLFCHRKYLNGNYSVIAILRPCERCRYRAPGINTVNDSFGKSDGVAVFVV